MHVGQTVFAIALGLAVITGGALVTGCAVPVPYVVRGELMPIGSSLYDDFFADVLRVRTEATAAAGDEESAHAGLVKALGLELSTKRTMAVDESGQRARKLSDKGVLLHLALTPEVHLLTARGKADIGPEGETLLRSMEEAARIGLDMSKRFGAVAARAMELESRRANLRAKAPADFRGVTQERRDQIILELDAAQGVIAEALEKANRAAGASARFAVELAQAIETGAEDAAAKAAAKAAPKRPAITLQPVPAPPPVAASSPTPLPASAAPAAPPPKPAAPPRPAARPAAAAPRPAAPAAPAAPPAKKKAKGGGDDFEP